MLRALVHGEGVPSAGAGTDSAVTAPGGPCIWSMVSDARLTASRQTPALWGQALTNTACWTWALSSHPMPCPSRQQLRFHGRRNRLAVRGSLGRRWNEVSSRRLAAGRRASHRGREFHDQHGAWASSVPDCLCRNPFPLEHAYRAIRGDMRIAAAKLAPTRHVFCPGLATGTGCVPPAGAAREMARTYHDWRDTLGSLIAPVLDFDHSPELDSHAVSGQV